MGSLHTEWHLFMKYLGKYMFELWWFPFIYKFPCINNAILDNLKTESLMLCFFLVRVWTLTLRYKLLVRIESSVWFHGVSDPKRVLQFIKDLLLVIEAVGKEGDQGGGVIYANIYLASIMCQVLGQTAISYPFIYLLWLSENGLIRWDLERN